MERTAKIDHEYWQRPIKAGQTVEVDQPDVEVMLMLGLIEPEIGEEGYVSRDIEATAPAEYVTRDMSPERQKRPYNRRGA